MPLKCTSVAGAAYFGQGGCSLFRKVCINRYEANRFGESSSKLYTLLSSETGYPNEATTASWSCWLISNGSRCRTTSDFHRLGPTGIRTGAPESTGRTVGWSFDGIYRLTGETVTVMYAFRANSFPVNFRSAVPISARPRRETKL